MGERLDCPLCERAETPVLLADGGRVYHHCAACDLIFLHPGGRLTPLGEVMRYLEHENDRTDPEYIRFLRRLGDPLCVRVPAGARGLDFGCGPVPALGEWLTRQDRDTVSYDPLFHPDETLLEGRYDFVTCSEVVEHAHHPRTLFDVLARLLRSGGVLGIMTRFHGVEAPFATWWYRRDPTHVAFYSETTMRWIAAHRGWKLELPVPNVALFTEAEGASAGA